MDVAVIIILFLLGLILIIKGGDLFVDAAAWIAQVSGVPPLIIGATIVSLATTLPEMLVSTIAASQGKVDMAIGNAVGSVTANIGLIMAISLLCMPGAIRRRDYLAKSLLMLGAAALVLLGGLQGQVGALLSALLLTLFALFLYENIKSATSMDAKAPQEARPTANKKEVAASLLKFVAGAAGIVIGADLLVDNGSALARLIGISERVIGVTMVAIGTSLPELVTTITAIAKKQSSLSVGNILGANILDLTLILPISALAAGKPLPIAAASQLDLVICLVVACIAIIPAMLRCKFERWQGVALLAVYCVYLGVTCSM